MAANKLASPLLRVLVKDEAEPIEVQTINADLVLWDRSRVKHKWPKFDEAPFLWMTFLSWSAAKRLGHIQPTTTYEQWEASVVDVQAVDPDEDDETGRPTGRAAAPD